MSEPEQLPESFEGLYRRQRGRLRRFFQASVRNSAAADDLTHDTFLDFWKRGSATETSRGGPVAYLLGIARKKGADWWRRESVPEHTALQTEPSEPSAILASLSIRDALERLAPDLRLALWLREVEGLSYQEISRCLAIPLGTVRSRLYAARQQLRIIWNKENS